MRTDCTVEAISPEGAVRLLFDMDRSIARLEQSMSGTSFSTASEQVALAQHAIEVLQRNGWYQGEYSALNVSVVELIETAQNEGFPHAVCVMGALFVAAGEIQPTTPAMDVFVQINTFINTRLRPTAVTYIDGASTHHMAAINDDLMASPADAIELLQRVQTELAT